MPSALACMNFASRSSDSRTDCSASRCFVMSEISTNAAVASPSLTTCGSRFTSIQRRSPSGPISSRSYDAPRRSRSTRSTCGWISRAAGSPMISDTVWPTIDCSSQPKVCA